MQIFTEKKRKFSSMTADIRYIGRFTFCYLIFIHIIFIASKCTSTYHCLHSRIFYYSSVQPSTLDLLQCIQRNGCVPFFPLRTQAKSGAAAHPPEFYFLKNERLTWLEWRQPSLCNNFSHHLLAPLIWPPNI